MMKYVQKKLLAVHPKIATGGKKRRRKKQEERHFQSFLDMQMQ